MYIANENGKKLKNNINQNEWQNPSMKDGLQATRLSVQNT